MRRKMIAGILIFAMLFTFVPTAVLADTGNSPTELDVSKGNIVIDDGTLDAYDKDGNHITTANPNGYIITGSYTISDSSKLEEEKVVIKDGNHNITIKNLSINVYHSYGGSLLKGASAFSVEKGRVNLTLEGANTLSGGYNHAGLSIGADASLTITEQSTGSLTATGGMFGAGIGGNYCGTVKNITIAGGTVTATGGPHGAGIGGGYTGAASNISITGGTVTANGTSLHQTTADGLSGAGIGGGYNGNGTDITISGGNVTASAERDGAGIGGGYQANGENITITGGEVTAKGGTNAAGIGGGKSGTGKNITISAGKVTATGGSNGAGIGGGHGCPGEYITISGGEVTASSDMYGAGIGGSGGGGNNIGRYITITGGKVTANGGLWAAGIGGGAHTIMGSDDYGNEDFDSSAQYGDGTDITISGGEVTATGGNSAAGIGGSLWGKGSRISIHGDATKVTAIGGYTSTGCWYGAGIGGGKFGDGTDITITGGGVIATGGYFAAGIGGGAGIPVDNSDALPGGDGRNIIISGGKINATGNSYMYEEVLYTPADIGSGWNGTTGTITICGGEFVEGETEANKVYDIEVAKPCYEVTTQGAVGYVHKVSLKDNGHENPTPDVVANGNDTHGLKYTCCNAVEIVACSGGEADCTNLAKCSVCETEYGALDTTNHTSDVVTYSNTAEGRHEKTYACCQITETEDCSGGTASCTAKAVCSKCNTEYGSELAHSYTVPQYNATHHWNKCANCDALDAKAEHTEETDAAVPATCTTTGLTEGSHCSVCNEKLVAQTVIPALGHTEVTDAAVAATCTATGLTKGKHCDVCKAVLVAQTVVEKVAHTYNDNNICDVCGDKKVSTSTGGGGFSGTYNYPVSTPQPDNGSVKLSDNNASAGETVTATVKPDKGYGVAEVIVTDEKGNVIPVTYLGNGEYSFVMPAGKVNIETICKPAITLTIGSQMANVFGKTVKNDVSPIITPEGRTMLPIRFIAEALGADVSWNADTQTVTITKDGTVVQIIIGADYAYINGEKVKLDSPAFIANGRTYLPVRFVAEALGADVNWDAATQQVVIMK